MTKRPRCLRSGDDGDHAAMSRGFVLMPFFIEAAQRQSHFVIVSNLDRCPANANKR